MKTIYKLLTKMSKKTASSGVVIQRVSEGNFFINLGLKPGGLHVAHI